MSKVTLKPNRFYSFNWDWRGKNNSKIICKVKKIDNAVIRFHWYYRCWAENFVDVDYKDNSFVLSKISQIKELSKEDIQDYLPTKHLDRIEVKQNKEEIMNKKSLFTVGGSSVLRKAFVEECGYKLYSINTIKNYNYLTPQSKSNTFQGSDAKLNLHFILPEDWDEAIKVTKEYFKEEPKFKKGDWIIYITQNGDGSGLSKEIGTKEQLIKIEGFKSNSKCSGLTDSEADFYAKTDKGYRNLSFKGIKRLATPEEIKSAQTKTLIVGDTRIKVTISNGKIEAEGRELSIDLVDEVLEDMEDNIFHENNTSWKITFPSVKIGCCTLSLDEVKLIKKTYEELND